MPVKVEIPDTNLTYYSNDAKDELQKYIEKYAVEIIKETGRLEETIRDDNNTPEITRVLVKQAISKYNNFFTRSKKSKGTVVVKIVATLSTFIAGLAYNFDSFKTDSNKLIIFGILFLIATISTVLMFLREGDEK